MAKSTEESALGFPRAMAPQHFAELHRQGDLLPGSLRSVVMEEMVAWRRQRTRKEWKKLEFFFVGGACEPQKKKQLYFPLNPGWILIMVYGF